ncbi:MAG: Cna B-type domain-containing protein, partial [Clostridia bacterium]|nr:Cna B-type domain-containing protein [Clostridia bacterium]
LMAARPRMAVNMTPAARAPRMAANGDSMTLATNESPSNVTTASPASAPEGYMEDSTFAVKTYTLTRNDDNWQHTFDAEDKYDGQGNPYYYYVVETACSLDYYDLTSYSGDPISGQDGTVTITNEAKRGSLTLTKTLASTTPAGETDKSFTFTIAFTGDKAADMAGQTYSATGAAGSVTVDGDRKATVTLKGGESVTLENLPYGVAYIVTEAEDPAYEQTDSTNTNGTVVKTTNASIENTRVVGQIDVTKTVKTNGGVDSTANGKKFWVGIFSDAAGTTRVAGQDDKQITIGADGTGHTSFTNLPVGTYYVYELTAENGSAVTGSSATIGGVEYSVTTDNSGAVISKASNTGTASITNNKTEKGSLTVNKVTLYNEQPDDLVAGKKINIGLYKVEGQSETQIGTQEITLGANGTGETTFQELDYGTYKVYELNDDGQIVTGASATINGVVYTVSGSGTRKTIDSNAKNESVIITNKTEEKGSLAVTKEIRVDGVKANLSGSFKVALYQVTGTEPDETETQVDEPMNITVTNGESTTAKFENLEIGGTYRVYEVRENGAGVEKVGERFGQYAVSYVNQTVTIPRGVDKDVTGTKVANNIETKAVEVDKKWFRPDGTEIENIQKASIVVQLKKGNEVVAQDAEGHVFGTEGAVTLPVEGSWSYTWAKLPKYGENGDEIEYTVVETSAKLGESELLTEEIQATRDADPNRANVFHLKNTLPTTEISVTKLWKDGTAQNSDRVFSEAKKIYFTLYRKLGSAEGETYKKNNAAIVGEVTYTPAANGNPASWSTWTCRDLPRFEYDENNSAWNAASYYVVETGLTGVKTTYRKGNEAEAATAEGAMVVDDDTGENRTVTIINEDIPVNLNIIKVDSNGMTKTLAGAGFELCRVDETNASIVSNTTVTATTDGENGLTSENGQARFGDLVSGYYKVTETEVPAGYVLTSSREFYVKVDIGAEQPIMLVNWTGQGWTQKGYDAKLTFDATTNTATVGNDAGAKLPSTGGSGTTLYHVLGTLLMLGAAVLLVVKKRMQA